MNNKNNTSDIFYNRIPNVPIYFALLLDIKNHKEKVLIGSKNAILYNLRDKSDTKPPFDENALIDILGEPAEVKLLYSATRPLGSFFHDLSAECKQDWAEFIYMPLCHVLIDASDYREYGLNFDWASEKFDLEKNDNNEDENLLIDEFYKNFKKVNNIKQFCENPAVENPIRKYVAFRIWNDFCKCKKEIFSYTSMKINAEALTRAFTLNNPQPGFRENNINEISFWVPNQLSSYETTLEIWYPDRHRHLECAIIENSFFPLISYYINHLYHAGFHLQKCKVCNKIFISDTLKQTMCGSKNCKRTQNKINKRNFDTKEKYHYEKSYDQVRRNFKNRINTLAKKTTISESELNHLEASYKEFMGKAKKLSKNLDTTEKMLAILTSNDADKMTSINSLKISLTKKREIEKCIPNPSALDIYITKTKKDLNDGIIEFKNLTSDSPTTDSSIGKMIKELENKYGLS